MAHMCIMVAVMHLKVVEGRVLFVEAMLGIFRKGMFPTIKVRIIPKYGPCVKCRVLLHMS